MQRLKKIWSISLILKQTKWLFWNFITGLNILNGCLKFYLILKFLKYITSNKCKLNCILFTYFKLSGVFCIIYRFNCNVLYKFCNSIPSTANWCHGWRVGDYWLRIFYNIVLQDISKHHFNFIFYTLFKYWICFTKFIFKRWFNGILFYPLLYHSKTGI